MKDLTQARFSWRCHDGRCDRRVAVGAFAIGAFAIGRLVIRRLSVENAKFRSLEIQDLTVTRLRAAEVIVGDSLKLPGDHKISL
jgi:hypothetical protein